MVTLKDKLTGVTNPNARIGRTVWSSPQGRERSCCSKCVYWVAKYSQKEDNNDPKLMVQGTCSNLRVAAAYGFPSQILSYYCCSLFEKKEKENVETDT